MHTRCIVRQAVLQGVFVKIGNSIKFKGLLVEFLENNPRKSPEKWIFLSLAFYNAPSLHTVKKSLERSFGKGMRRSKNQRRTAPFHLMGSNHSVNERIGKEFYRKANY